MAGPGRQQFRRHPAPQDDVVTPDRDEDDRHLDTPAPHSRYRPAPPARHARSAASVFSTWRFGLRLVYW